MKKNMFIKGLTGLVASTLIAGAAFAADMKTVAIANLVDVPPLVETKDGIIEGLKMRGWIVGENLTVDYKQANGKMDTNAQIVKRFIGQNPDVLVAITTPTAQAAVANTKDIPIVFAAITDPVKAELISQYIKPGKNVTGVSDAAPIATQLELFKKIVPGLKKIGFIYNPGLDNALATLGWLKEESAKMGITVVESAAPTVNEVLIATKRLVGKVDAIYVPNDTTVISAIAGIIKIGQDTDTPIFAGETGHVEVGVIASVGLDYFAHGIVAGGMVADILDGQTVGDIDALIAYKNVTDFKIVVNLASAAKMGVTIPADVIASATQVFE